MKLESDPTTIYGLTLGKTPFNRELTRADLQSNTPYNTYVIDGMPPTPIAMPGRASLEAAVDPLLLVKQVQQQRVAMAAPAPYPQLLAVGYFMQAVVVVVKLQLMQMEVLVVVD